MAITREELIAWATRNGWKLDRWGHLKKEFDNGTHRIKLSRIAARHEISTPFGCYAEFGIAATMPNSGLCRTS
jgi:hypothetical protein